MKKKRKTYKLIRFVSLFCTVLGVTFIALGAFNLLNLKVNYNKVAISNINLERSISDEELVENYSKINRSSLSPVFYPTFKDAVSNAKYYTTSFKGKLTHYGPDCALCGGTLGCNGKDVRNGDIYYEDKQYGRLRIVATSKVLPCGSILRVNIPQYDNMYVIVLDRGVSAGIVDLLKESEKAKSPVRTTNNVIFDIVRYGYGK